MPETILVAAVLALLTGLPLAWKWELGVGRCAAVLAALAVASGAAVAAVGAEGAAGGAAAGLLALGAAAALLLWRFYRDPERTSPEGDDLVVSPADGQVIYVKRSAGGELPAAEKHGRTYTLDELVRTPLSSREAVVIGIALSFLDVHVNRSPIAGRVTVQRRFPGRFASLKDPSAVFVNERATTVLEQAGSRQVAVVLIASRLVRRIVSYVREGEDVAAGQRIGVIRFGSQVDLVLPAEDALEILVEPGMRLRAGETIVARL